MFGWKKKVDKAAWAEAIYQKKIMRPENEPDEKLSKLTTFMLEQHHRIIWKVSRLRCQLRMLIREKDVLI